MSIRVADGAAQGIADEPDPALDVAAEALGEDEPGAAGRGTSPPWRSVLSATRTSPAAERDRLVLLGASAAPIDAGDYRLGPGDGLGLSIARTDREPVQLTVDAEGSVVLPGAAGRLTVAGLSLAAARVEVGRALEREFRDQSFELTLTRLRRFKVFVTGAVAAPGTYVASATTRISEVIEQAGGVEPGGSARRIVVDRVDGSRLEADLVSYARLGRRERNPFADAGDIVRVPPASRFFSVLGGVAEPGRYELVDGETLADGVALAGDLLPEALRASCEWRRLQDGMLTSPERVDLDDPRITGEVLRHGDVLVVQRAAHLDRTATVEVVGEVRFPGYYPVTPGVDTVGDLVARAGGFSDWSNRGAARVFRATSAPFDERARGALVSSPVESPMAIERQVERLEERDWPHGLRLDGEAEALAAAGGLPLEAGDVLYVPRQSGRIVVDGRVRQPGWIAWSVDRRVRDYVELAGGYDRDADRSRLLVRRAGSPPGEVEVVGAGDRLGDGDTIWVPERGRVGWWRRAREASAFLAQIATVVIIIDQALKN